MTVFYAYNLVDDAIITASSENASFPASNLQDSRRTKVFRSTSTSCNIVLDIKTAEPVDSFAISENPTYGFGFITPITIEANATNEWTSPAFSTTLTASDLDQEHGFGYKEFTSQEYRFWRLSFNGSSYVEVSNFFLGSKIDLSTNDFDVQFSFSDEDIVSSETNNYGQRFFDDWGKQRSLLTTISYMNKTEVDLFLEMYDHNRTIKPVYIRFDCDILNEINRFNGPYFLDKKPKIKHDAPSLYSVDLDWAENK